MQLHGLLLLCVASNMVHLYQLKAIPQISVKNIGNIFLEAILTVVLNAYFLEKKFTNSKSDYFMSLLNDICSSSQSFVAIALKPKTL